MVVGLLLDVALIACWEGRGWVGLVFVINLLVSLLVCQASRCGRDSFSSLYHGLSCDQ